MTRPGRPPDSLLGVPASSGDTAFFSGMEKPEFILEFEKPLRDLERQLDTLRQSSEQSHVDVAKELTGMVRKLETTKREIYTNLTAWQRVQLARHPKRPNAGDYLQMLFQDFQELRGDRCFGDDQALIGGTAFFRDQPVMVLAQLKGKDTKENIRRNFGMPHPEGYRKAKRLMEMAARFRLPVFAFIDTPGAFPGLGGEERHVAEAIAVNLREMSVLETPTISVVISEGGSGGALGIGVTDRILIFEHAYYSVISPEACSAILWKDRANAPRAADALKLGAKELKELGVVDEVIREPLGGSHRDPEAAAKALGDVLSRHLGELKKLPMDALLDQRYAKFRQLGPFLEG